jgi:hypothetical protein
MVLPVEEGSIQLPVERSAPNQYQICKVCTKSKTLPRITLITMIYTDQKSSMAFLNLQIRCHPCSSVVRFGFVQSRSATQDYGMTGLPSAACTNVAPTARLTIVARAATASLRCFRAGTAAICDST